MTGKVELNANPTGTPEPALKKTKGEARGIRLDDELVKEAGQVCAEEGIALPELVRNALRAHLQDPTRQRQQVLRSVALTRSQVERAKADGAMPTETAEELLEKLGEFEAVAQGANPGPKPKRKRFRFPPWPFPTLLSWGSEDDE